MIKRILLGSVFSLLVSSLFAQVEVVLRVDMTHETISSEGLFAIGTFQDWSLKNAIELESDGNDIYTATLTLEPGNYQFAFLNGHNEAIQECQESLFCQEECFTDAVDGQRVRNLTVEENVLRQTLAAYIFNSCEETLPASIEELKASGNLSISPNPFSDNTTLAFANPKNQAFDILLFDIQGQLIRNYPGNRGEKFEIDRFDLSTGIYVLTLRTDKGEVANRKLVVH